MQLTGQFVFMHAESVSIALFLIVQSVPPLLAGVVILYVLVFCPISDLEFIPSQTPLHSVQLIQPPMQLIGQLSLVHVESVSICLSV